MICSRENSDLY